MTTSILQALPRPLALHTCNFPARYKARNPRQEKHTENKRQRQKQLNNYVDKTNQHSILIHYKLVCAIDFSVRLLSVLRGYSVFHPRHNGQ